MVIKIILILVAAAFFAAFHYECGTIWEDDNSRICNLPVVSHVTPIVVKARNYVSGDVININLNLFDEFEK